MDSGWAVVFGTLAGGSITLIGQWITRWQEERKFLLEFSVKTAVENWREVSAQADVLKMPRHEFGPNTLDGYLIRTLALIEILRRRKSTPAELEKRLAEMEEIGRVLTQHLQKVPTVKKQETAAR